MRDFRVPQVPLGADLSSWRSASVCVSRTMPDLNALSLLSTREQLQRLRAGFSSTNSSLCLACPGGQGKGAFGLHLCPAFAQQIRRFHKSGNPVGRPPQGVCWFPPPMRQPAMGRQDALSLAPWGLGRSRLSLSSSSVSSPQSLQAPKSRAPSMFWPLCKIQSLFFCEGKYYSSFQSHSFNKRF